MIKKEILYIFWLIGMSSIPYVATLLPLDTVRDFLLLFGLLLIVFFSFLFFSLFFLRKILKEFILESKIPVWILIFFIFILIFSLVFQEYALKMELWGKLFFGFLDIFFIFFFLGMLVLLSISIGESILKFFGYYTKRKMSYFLVSFAMGMGCFGYSLYLFTLFFGINNFSFLGIVLFLSFIFYKKIFHFLRDFFSVAFSFRIASHFGIEVIPWIILILIFLSSFLSSLGSLLSGGWDTFHQYLTFPETYARLGHIIPFAFHPHWGFPQLGEILFMAGYFSLGLLGPFVLHWLLYVFSALAFFDLLSVKGGKGSLKIWFVLVFSTFPFLLNMSFFHLKIDLFLYFFFLVTLLVFRDIIEKISLKKSLGTYSIFGILLGFLMSIKYTAVFFIIFFLSIFFVFWILKKIRIQHILIVTLFMFIAMFPWMVKDLSFYSSPFYPLMDGKNIYSSQNGDSCHKEFTQQIREDVIFIYSWKFDIKREAVSFINNVKIFFISHFLLGNNSFLLNNPGIYFFLFLPVILFFQWRKFSLFDGIIFIFSWMYFFFWAFFLSGQIWYLGPSFFLWLYIAFIQISRKTIVIQNAVKISIFFISTFLIFIFSLISNIPTKLEYFRNEIDLSEGFEQISCDKVDKRCDSGNYFLFQASQFLNNRIRLLKEDVKIYGLFEPQGYFLQDSYKNFIPDFFGELFLCFSKEENPKEVLKKFNVKYILFYRFRANTCLHKENMEENKICIASKNFKSFLEENQDIVFIKSYGEEYEIYEIQ
ncbi:MAG: hypothetical protein IPN70_02340 [Candidatus Moraniibacteriota bacterium]|nr:MAG: hypothetical protein IPN70_02340 [Candidatus Moranbacteria bacterium]